jgi:hypothetical protein
MANKKPKLNNIAYVLKEQGRYQNKLALKLGVRTSVVNAWCNQVSQPPLEWLFVIADLLDVHISELINQDFKYSNTDLESIKKSNPFKKTHKHTEPMKKIISGLRSGLHKAVKKRNEHLNISVLKLLGCTGKQLADHLESKFTDGMSWENYGRGGWHVDHVRPISHFNFTSQTSPEFKKCWSLNNLQPLWETTRIINGVEYTGNLNKNNRLI